MRFGRGGPGHRADDEGVIVAPDIAEAIGETDVPDGSGDTAGDPVGDVADDIRLDGETVLSCGSLPLPSGCACQQDKDCESGVCEEGAAGNICAASCTATAKCAGVGACVAAPGNTGQQICVNVDARACRPCMADGDCTVDAAPTGRDGKCVEYGPAGSFCGYTCLDATECPDGYDCAAVPAGALDKVCKLKAGNCPCTDYWKEQAFKTTCYVSNTIGKCTADRTCEQDCAAAIPSAPTAPTMSGTTPASPSFSTAPAVNGTAQAGASVSLFAGTCGGTAIGSGKAGSAGDFSINANVTENGTTQIVAWTVASICGTEGGTTATSPCAPALAYVNDDVVPFTPVILGSQPPSPSNKIKTPLIQGTAEPGSMVTVYATTDVMAAPCSATPAGSITATAGQFSLLASVDANTSTIFTATSIDAAGNVSKCSDPYVYVELEQKPDAPIFTGTDPTSPSNVSSPAVQGTTTAGNLVILYTDAACEGEPAGSGKAGAGGTFKIVATAKQNATVLFYATTTDAAGNVSDCTVEPLSYTHDGVPPDAPDVQGMAPSSPNKATNPSVIGTAETGSIVHAYTSANCSGNTDAGHATTDSNGNFQVPVTVTAGTSTQFWAQATDVAGNIGPCSLTSTTYVQDPNLPDSPMLKGTTPASPSKTHVGVHLFGDVGANGKAGWTLKVYTTQDCSDAVLATSTTGTAGAFDVVLPDLAADQVITYYATVTNASNNTSGCSIGLTYVADNTSPGAPGDLATVPDTASLPTNVAAPTVKGAVLKSDHLTAEAGAAVALFVGVACTGTPVANGVTAADGSFQIDSAAVIANLNSTATVQIYAQAMDAALNVSPCSTAVAYRYDGQAPTPAILSLIAGTDPALTNPKQGVYYTNAIPSGTPPIVSEIVSITTFEAGLTVDLYGDEPGAAPCTTKLVQTTANGQIVSLPANATTILRAIVTDLAGNSSGCKSNAVSFTADSIAPDPAVLTAPTGRGNNQNPVVTGANLTTGGVVEANATVEFYHAPDCAGGPSAAYGKWAAQADGSFGHAVAATTTPQAGATNTFSVMVYDAAGNASVCSNNVTYIYDSVAPDPAAFLYFTPSSPNTSDQPTVSGTAEAGSSVELFVEDPACTAGTAVTGVAGHDGTKPTQFDIVVTVGATAGATKDSKIYAKVTDIAGNTSATCVLLTTYTNDRKLVVVPWLDDVTPHPAGWPNGTGKTNKPTVSGWLDSSVTTGKAGWTVALFSEYPCPASAQAATGTTDANGKFSIVVDGSAWGNDWSRTFWVQVKNLSGNWSQCSPARFVRYDCDNTGPAAPALTGYVYPSPFIAAPVDKPNILGIASEYGLTVRLYNGACPASCGSTTGLVGTQSTAAPTSSAWTPVPTPPTSLPIGVAGFPNVAVNSTAPVTGTAPGWDDTLLAAQAQDAAGNCSQCSTTTTQDYLTYHYDGWKPVNAPTMVGISPTAGTHVYNSTDYYSSDQPRPVVTILPQDGDTFRIYLYEAADCGGTAIPLPGWKDGSNPTEWTSGSLTYQLSSLPIGSTVVLSARSVDRAGNLGACTPANNQLTYTYDNTPPATPNVFLDSQSCPVAGRCGALAGRGNASVGHLPAVDISMAPAFGTVSIYMNSACTSPGKLAGYATFGASTSGTLELNPAKMVQGVNPFWVQATSAAGVAGTCASTGVTFDYDNTNNDFLAAFLYFSPAPPSNVLTPTVVGTTEQGASVQLYTTTVTGTADTTPNCQTKATGPSNGIGTAPGDDPAGTPGKFGVVVNVPSTPGTQTYTKVSAYVTDSYGNQSATCYYLGTYTQDTTVVPAPTNMDVTPHPAGWPNGTGKTNRPTVSGHGTVPAGTACAGCAVQIYMTDTSGTGCGTLVATGSTSGSGDFAVTVPGDTLSWGTNWQKRLAAKVQNSSGNWSGCGSYVEYDCDNTGPTAPVVSPYVYRSVPVPFVADNVAAPTLNGAGAEYGLTVRLYSGSTCPACEATTGLLKTVSTTAPSSGAWTPIPTPASPLAVAFAALGLDTSTPGSLVHPFWRDTQMVAMAEDVAGNCSACSAVGSYEYDGWAPTAAPTFSDISSATHPDSTNKYFSTSNASPTITVLPHDADTFRVYLFEGTAGAGGACPATPVFDTNTFVSSGWVNGAVPREWTASDLGVPITVTNPLSVGVATAFTWASVDRAGNVGPCDPSGIVYTYDNVVPAAATLTLAAATPTPGKIAPILNLTGAPAYGSIKLFANGTCSSPAISITPSPTADVAGTAAIPVPLAAVAYGPNTYSAKVAKPGGDIDTQGTCSSTVVSYTYDNKGPNAPNGTGFTYTLTQKRANVVVTVAGTIAPSEPVFPGESGGTAYVFKSSCPPAGTVDGAIGNAAYIGTSFNVPGADLGSQPSTTPTNYPIFVVGKDSLGNVGACSSQGTYPYSCIADGLPACATAADCCAGDDCRNNSADKTATVCKPTGCSTGSCAGLAECCVGLTCHHSSNGTLDYTHGLCDPDSCVTAGHACTAQASCCTTSTCRSGGPAASGTCGVGTCATSGTCSSQSDCCYNYLCHAGSQVGGSPTNGVCSGYSCNSNGSYCSVDTDCCVGNVCDVTGHCAARCSVSGSNPDYTGYNCCPGLEIQWDAQNGAPLCKPAGHIANGMRCDGSEPCASPYSCYDYGGSYTAGWCAAMINCGTCSNNNCCLLGDTCRQGGSCATGRCGNTHNGVCSMSPPRTYMYATSAAECCVGTTYTVGGCQNICGTWFNCCK